MGSSHRRRRRRRRLQEYLIINEAGGRGVSMDESDAIRLLESKCSKALKRFITGNGYIARIIKGTRDYYSFVDTRKLPARMSKNTENYYTLIINDDPIWQSYPRRQMICTASGTQHLRRGEIYIIFPYNGTVVGVCPTSDIWNSFPWTRQYIRSANDMNKLIKDLLESVIKGSSAEGFKKLATFKEACNKFDEVFATEFGGDYTKIRWKYGLFKNDLVVAFFDDLYKNDLYKAILKVYKPKGFKKSTSEKLNNIKGNEVWFDGAAVVVKEKIALDLWRLA